MNNDSDRNMHTNFNTTDTHDNNITNKKDNNTDNDNEVK